MRARRLRLMQSGRQAIAVAERASRAQMLTHAASQQNSILHRGFKMLSLIALYIEHRRRAA
jgi:hypothetical protein